jgi:hypothetical protein
MSLLLTIQGDKDYQFCACAAGCPSLFIHSLSIAGAPDCEAAETGGYCTLSAYILSSNPMYHWVRQHQIHRLRGMHLTLFPRIASPTVKALECLYASGMCASAHCIHSIFMFKPTTNPTSDTLSNHNTFNGVSFEAEHPA